MDESYAQRAMRDGPLPKADEESELVGEKNDQGVPESQDADEAAEAEEDDSIFLAVPNPGAGSAAPLAAPTRVKRDDEAS